MPVSWEFVPPYTAPIGVIYPELSIVNPYLDSKAVQPVFPNLPSESLFRPARLPSDMDSKIDKSCVWAGLDKNTR
jgi:hypothetical protein